MVLEKNKLHLQLPYQKDFLQADLSMPLQMSMLLGSVDSVSTKFRYVKTNAHSNLNDALVFSGATPNNFMLSNANVVPGQIVSIEDNYGDTLRNESGNIILYAPYWGFSLGRDIELDFQRQLSYAELELHGSMLRNWKWKVGVDGNQESSKRIGKNFPYEPYIWRALRGDLGYQKLRLFEHDPINDALIDEIIIESYHYRYPQQIQQACISIHKEKTKTIISR